MATFTVELTGKQAARLKELAAYWRSSPEEELQCIAVNGIEMELQVKAHDEREAAGVPRSRDLDDGIPF
jgi:hypothetical protein